MRNKRRIEIATGNPGISVNYVDMDFEHGTAVNIHGFRYACAIEPQDADANCNGIIGIYVLPGGVIQNSDLPSTFGTFGDEATSPYLWGIMPFVASNQTPAHLEFNPKTSRTMQRGGRIVAVLRIEGVSAGLVRHVQTLTCFTSDA